MSLVPRDIAGGISYKSTRVGRERVHAILNRYGRNLRADPTVVLDAILKVREDLDRNTAPYSIDLTVVRPGTLAALHSYLRQKPRGYYHIVHFDVHGDVKRTMSMAEVSKSYYVWLIFF